MRRTDRLSQILELLLSDGSLDVDALAERFAVSPSTVRRDLGSLESQRLLVRTRGGAQTHSAFNDLPLRFKVGHMLPEKRRIARAARELIDDARVIGINGGTTTTEFARTVVDRDDLTIVTNALNIAVDLLAGRRSEVFIAGGEGRNTSFEAVGPSTEEFFGGYNIDLAVIGVDGVDPRAGCTVYDQLGARAIKALLRQARRTVVLADGSKFGKVALTQACSLSAIDVLITDSSAGTAVLDAISTRTIVA